MIPALLITLVGAYLLGSIPTGYLVGRARGLDLRTLGSGNIGATNALRILGKPAGILVLVVDGLKGLGGVALVPQVGRAVSGGSLGESELFWMPVVGGVSAVLGHNFTCWLRFRGGKGIATSAGVLAGLMPMAFATVVIVFTVTLLVSRFVSLGSILAAAVLPPATWFWHRDLRLVGFATALAALAIWRHRGNIQRLRAGTESRIGQARSTQAREGTRG